MDKNQNSETIVDKNLFRIIQKLITFVQSEDFGTFSLRLVKNPKTNQRSIYIDQTKSDRISLEQEITIKY